MAKQQSTSIIQWLIQFIKDFDSNPYQDFYIFLVLRFFIYIYLFIKLSDILLGYQKPNLKTRVLQKFQFVYGQQILKQLDKDDMQQLQTTISNTILNATKQLQIKSMNNKLVIDIQKSKDPTIKSGLQSQRRYLKNQQICDSTGSTLSKKSFKLKFDLNKNDYYQHLSAQNSILSSGQKQQSKIEQLFSEIQVQGQSQQQNLSPKHKKIINQKKQFPKPIDIKQQANIHYPQQQLSGMQLQMQEKLVKRQQNLLHLSDIDLTNSLMGNQFKQQYKDNHNIDNNRNSNDIHDINDINDNNKQEYENFPSIIKTQSTRMTDSYIQQPET